MSPQTRKRQERLSVSIAIELVAYVREEAARLNLSQSTVISEALTQRRVEALRREIIEGLLEDAEQQRATAREGMAAAPRFGP
jgi:hypothetical protein